MNYRNNFQCEINRLTDELNRQIIYSQQINNENIRLYNENGKLNNDNSILNKMIFDNKKFFDEKLIENGKLNDELKNKVSEYEKKISELNKEITDLKSKNNNNLTSLIDMAEKFKHTVNKYKQNSMFTETKIRHLTDQNKILSEINLTLKTEVTNLTDQNKNLSENNLTLETKVKNLTDQNKNLSENNLTLETEVTNLTDQNEKLNKQLNNLKDKINDFLSNKPELCTLDTQKNLKRKLSEDNEDSISENSSSENSSSEDNNEENNEENNEDSNKRLKTDTSNNKLYQIQIKNEKSKFTNNLALSNLYDRNKHIILNLTFILLINNNINLNEDIKIQYINIFDRIIEEIKNNRNILFSEIQITNVIRKFHNYDISIDGIIFKNNTQIAKLCDDKVDIYNINNFNDLLSKLTIVEVEDYSVDLKSCLNNYKIIKI